MNPLAFLSPYKWLLYGAFAIALIGGGTILVHRYNDGLREEGRAEVRAADKAAMQAQADRNRELQRAAETRYTVQAGVRDHYITETITEVRYAAAPLASCPVGADAVRLLNAAADCARADSAAGCGAGQPVPIAR